MFSFFKRSKTLEECGVLSGYTDWHSHILPGVDDGVETMEEALQILVQYERLGVRHLCLTPHIMADIPNKTDELKKRFAELTEAFSRLDPTHRITLSLASENMIDALFMERLEKDDFLTLGPKKRSILVETSYYDPPIDFFDTLKCVKAKGYRVVLAHPERYHYMGEKEYVQLREMNVEFQLNMMSLFGTYGKDVCRKAQDILSKGWYGISGTDLHSAKSLDMILSGKLSKKDEVALMTIG